ncbi:MAG: ABC transporter permease [Clostridia bacterium]|nr:ABC transporter permease [Clostridia bacterium]
MRKELARFFKDPRLVITTLLLPGLMIYAVYSFMGDGLSTQFSTPDEYVYRVEAVNLSNHIKEYFKLIDYVDINEVSSYDEGKEKLDNGDIDLLVVFPEKFDELISVYSSGKAPNVELYYNSSQIASAEAQVNMTNILNAFESAISNRFDINNSDKEYDLATEKDTTSQIFATMLPMLLMVFLFSGCMSVAPESIAGEKERGTIATLLVTPVKRSELAIGKILSISFIALLSGISSFLGTMSSLPKLMGLSDGGMDASVYGVSDYALLLSVILSTILVIVSVISIISAFSKTVKEANTAVLPLMIIVMLIGVTTMFGQGAPSEAVWYLVPMYNSVQCMNAIFAFSHSTVNIITTLCVNVSISIVLLIVLAKMFSSEKIMFSK